MIQYSSAMTTKDNENFELIIAILLGSLIFFEYVFIWRLYEVKIEEEIVKTKKMLSIIPVESLLKISNIGKLLHIDGIKDSTKKETL